jgi:sulfate adenylyltransferase subunit 1
MSAVMTLEDDIDISRGDMIAKPGNLPRVSQDLDIMVCWFSENKLALNGRYVVRHTTREVRAIVKDVRYKININTLHRVEGDSAIGRNDIGRLRLRTTAPLCFDSYKRNRSTGSLILVDEFTNQTVAAGMILDADSQPAPGGVFADMGGI